MVIASEQVGDEGVYSVSQVSYDINWVGGTRTICDDTNNLFSFLQCATENHMSRPSRILRRVYKETLALAVLRNFKSNDFLFSIKHFQNNSQAVSVYHVRSTFGCSLQYFTKTINIVLATKHENVHVQYL